MNNKLIIGLAVVLAFGSCKKDTGEGVPVTFNVKIERSLSKVHIGADMKPRWDSTDSIRINDGDGKVTPDENNDTRGTFTATITGASGPYYAIFPARIASGRNLSNSGEQNVTLPRVQHYKTLGGVQLVDAPMAAYNPGSANLEFKNLCGLLRVVVTNDKAWDMILDSVQVEATASGICGTMPIRNFTHIDPYLESVNASGKVVSLAGSANSSMNIFVKSNMWEGEGETSCSVYVYIPSIASESNKFTIRVFSHPAWNGKNSPGDSEVHIVYTRTQRAEVAGNIGRGELLTVPMSLAACGNDGTTFTSMKKFALGGTSGDVCISRGHVQFKPSNGPANDGTNNGTWRFSPRQWYFLQKTTMRDSTDEHAYAGWFEHFTYDAANNPKHRFHAALSGSDTKNAFRNGRNDLSGVHDFGYNFDKATGSHETWHTPSWQEFHDLENNCHFVWCTLTDVPKVDGGTCTTYCCMFVPTAVRDNNLDGIINYHNRADASALSLPQYKTDNGSGKKTVKDNVLNVAQMEYYEARGCIIVPCIGVFDGLGHKHKIWNGTTWTLVLGDHASSTEFETSYWSSTFKSVSTSDADIIQFTANYDDSGVQNFDGVVRVYQAGSTTIREDSECYRRLCVRLFCPYGTPYKYHPDQM